jgi:hypothetical protein
MVRRDAEHARPHLLVRLVAIIFKSAWAAVVVATPVLGAWAASSLAAYGNAFGNASVAMTAAAGLVLFPVLPLAWEGWAALRRRRRGVTSRRFLTFGDRLVLRTLLVNLVFLGALVGTRPAAAFAALSTRGDWMLDGRHDGRSETARRWLFRAADRLEWVYLAVHEDEFARKGAKPAPAPSASQSPAASAAPTSAPSPTTAPPVASTSASARPPEPSASGAVPPTPPALTALPAWPVSGGLHPAVVSMPHEAEASITTVAAYIREHEPSDAGRLKAAHDWVADRVAYDAPAFLAGKYPPEDAESVFRSRLAVCAGYATLMEALGKALGLEVSYISGDARNALTKETGAGHAWNAAHIDGRDVLMDVTWDSGSVNGAKFVKGYTTDYYLTPPEVFAINHFPSDARWQLLATPISRGDFFRQPMVTPRFFAEHRELISPLRSQVTVRGPLDIEMRTPPGLFTLATWKQDGGTPTDCAVTRGEVTRVHCDLPVRGAYRVELFSNVQQYGSPYWYIGQVEANREL